MTQNNKKYKCFDFCNNGNSTWGFNWMGDHKEWREKKGKKNSVWFVDSDTNTMIYLSYNMAISEESMDEEQEGGDDSQDTDLISLINFDLLEWLIVGLLQ